MYIVIGLGFLLLIICIIALIFFIASYNTLKHLEQTALATLEEICLFLEKHGYELHANTLITQTNAINKLGFNAGISKQKRFYTTTVKDLNDRLVTFPGNIFSKIVGITTLPLLTLSEQENEGISPEAKNL